MVQRNFIVTYCNGPSPVGRSRTKGKRVYSYQTMTEVCSLSLPFPLPTPSPPWFGPLSAVPPLQPFPNMKKKNTNQVCPTQTPRGSGGTNPFSVRGRLGKTMVRLKVRRLHFPAFLTKGDALLLFVLGARVVEGDEQGLRHLY